VDDVIRAAGGVLHRRVGDRKEIAIVHRPRHDDWSLPKGKRKRGEHPVTNAYREVWEETGVRPVIGIRLPTVAYQVPVDASTMSDKTVDYWAMTPAAADGAGFLPGDETDELVWLGVGDALSRLSYERDVTVVTAFAALPPVRPPIVLVRHASAGDRRTFVGDDDARPLDADGEALSAVLAPALNAFAPQRLVSAGPRRCQDTLAPLASLTELPVVVDHRFDEEADPTAAAAAVRELIGDATVICSQGKLIPAVLSQLSGGTEAKYRTAKGDGWVLSFGDDSALVALDPLA
jgi:8-oxo-dGTP diphosphatase